MAANSSKDGFLPKSIVCLRGYNLKFFLADLLAGITVGFVALPLAMAFAIASGVAPQSGIYCAIFAGFIISALGGSKTQIGGPTGAFVVVISGIVLTHGVDGLYMCTLMAGALLVLIGATGLGTAVRYIPRPVVIGFTNGIAVLIASTQIKDFFGLQIAHVPGDFIGRMQAIFTNWFTLDNTSMGLGICSLLVIVLVNKYVKPIPGSIVALFLGTLVSWLFDLPIETIQTRFGGIPGGLPPMQWPTFQTDLILPLLAPTLTIAMLGAIESLLSAVVSDKMSNDRHNPNVELVAQGVANIVSPLFGGLPATGAIARTATNIKSGAKSPLAGMIHALTLLIVILVAVPLAELMPLCMLSAILFVVAYNMGEWREIPKILRLSTSSVIVWAVTFLLTVFADLTVAVEAGMIMAMLLYIKKVTGTTTVELITSKYVELGVTHSLQLNPLPDGVAAFRINGPLLFGSTDKLETIELALEELPKVIVLRMRNMNAIDMTGVNALESLVDTIHRSGRQVLLCGLRDQPARIMKRAEFHKTIGENNLCPSIRDAIVRARELLF